MSFRRFVFFVFALLLSLQAGAKDHELSKGSWFAGIQVDFSDTNIQDNFYIPNGAIAPAPWNLDRFTVETPDTLSLDVTLGFQQAFNHPIISRVFSGFSYQHVFEKSIEGDIWQYSIPEFLNYRYQFDIRSDVYSLFTKIHLFQHRVVKPYLSAKLGMAVNQMGDYTEQALPEVTARYSPAYAPRQSRQFSYSLGAGFDFAFSNQLFLTLGYLYQDLGRAESGRGLGTWKRTNIRLQSIERQALSVGVVYIHEDL